MLQRQFGLPATTAYVDSAHVPSTDHWSSLRGGRQALENLSEQLQSREGRYSSGKGWQQVFELVVPGAHYLHLSEALCYVFWTERTYAFGRSPRE